MLPGCDKKNPLVGVYPLAGHFVFLALFGAHQEDLRSYLSYGKNSDESGTKSSY